MREEAFIYPWSSPWRVQANKKGGKSPAFGIDATKRIVRQNRLRRINSVPRPNNPMTAVAGSGTAMATS